MPRKATWAAIVILLLLIVAANACGGNGRGAGPTVIPSSPRQTRPVPRPVPAPFSLAPASELLASRSGSFTLADGYADGADFQAGMPNGRVSAAGASAGFLPAYDAGEALSELAYAVYGFTLPDYDNDAPVDIQLSFSDAPPLGSAWVGLSDFDSGRWDWFELPADGRLSFAGFTEFVSPSDEHLLAVACTGTEASVLDSIQLITDQPPVASLVPDVDSGVAPLTVNLDASASVDPVGNIVKFEWDINGNNFFSEPGEEFAALNQDHATVQFDTAEVRTITVRVTDDSDLSDEASVQITVTGSQPPVADLTANPESGPKVLEVDLNATGSNDPDSPITDYEWDYDGDGNFSEADNGEDTAHGNPLAQASYSVVGIYNATVRVSDGDGGSDTASVQIDVSNTPPVADIQATPTEGNAPLLVDFSAEASYDPAGTIVETEWDFDGDGLFNETGTQEETAHNNGAPGNIDYPDVGSYDATVRVTDEDGATDTASITVTAHGWTVITVDDPAGATNINHCNLALVNGNPAIAYVNLGSGVRFGRSSSATGASPADWTFINVPGNSGEEISMAMTAIGPGIAAYSGSGSGDLIYQVAEGNGTDAAEWSSVVTVDSAGFTGRFPVLRLTSGNPAICYWDSTGSRILQARSIDNRGDIVIDWFPPAVIEDAGAGQNVQSLTAYDVIAGHPCTAYYSYTNPADQLRFRRSSDSVGDGNSDWASSFDLETNNGSGSWWCFGLQALSGNPAAIYRSGQNNAVFFRTASAADGSTWNAAVNIGSSNEIGQFGCFTLIGGVPALAYQTNANADVKFILSETAGGGASADWDTVETVDTTDFVGGHIKLIDLGGKPAMCYVDNTTLAVKYAIKL